ncbi:hypothetical protein SLEP1_g1118 [Rubroshorea leprosula]|uniref:CCHC-type domain-containing protein n=1 Tax=Rubroshorea leprosula TaxID=152421 RepID=A0AAV5HMB8_9ROSI|nr:hypothetical protein SLEP1_g1118 [Rubroshorea leprosula]
MGDPSGDRLNSFMITDYVVRQGYDRVSIKDIYYMQPWMDMPDGLVSYNSDSAIREMNDIISYASNVELYVDHDINILEIVESPLLLTGDVSKDEGDNSGNDVSVHGDEDDSAWSLRSDKTDDEQVSIAKLAQEVRKRRRNATRSSRKKSKAVVQTATRNEQEDDHVEEPVVTQEQPFIQQQQQPAVTDDQATVQEAIVTDAAGIEETATCSRSRKRKYVTQHKVRRGGGNMVRKGDPIDNTQQLPVSDGSGSSTDEEDKESDYADSDYPGAWEFHWNSDDEDDIFVQPDHVVSRNVCQTYYNPKWKVPYFDIGMRFKDAKQFKMAVCKYSIQKTYYGEHRCFKSYDNELVTYKVGADLFKGRIYEAPFTKPAKIVKWCKTEIKVNITLDKAEKAKKHVMTQLEGSYVDEYKYLKSYAKILRDSHPENTVVVTAIETSFSDTRTFHRMYVCLHSLKQGWKDGCRRFFGVDGCFLKGICKGILLSVVGKDGNHQMFPIAWAVVESECLESWHCARHIYCNWAKLGHRGDEMKICFWNYAKATFQDDFIDKLGDLFAKNRQGHDDLLGYPREHWCKAFIQDNCKCDSIDNNISETFNSWILGARYWQLSGVPCPHALACIRYKRWRVEHCISNFYKKEKYLAAYAYPLQCIRKGTKAWKAMGEEELLPPPVRSMPGRPRRKRRRHKSEPQKMKKGKLRKLTGKGRKMTCKVCGNEGHNGRTCPYNNEEGRNESASARVKITVSMITFGW